jgi:hypothetical protein
VVEIKQITLRTMDFLDIYNNLIIKMMNRDKQQEEDHSPSNFTNASSTDNNPP